MFEAHPLSELLEKERSAIVSGAFEDLTLLAPEKERLLLTLTTQDVGVRHLRMISAAVSRNQTLLAAAIEGVKTVAERIEVLRKARDGFETYDRSGERSHVGTPRTGFERKA
jgi:hypothetical protein